MAAALPGRTKQMAQPKGVPNQEPVAHSRTDAVKDTTPKDVITEPGQVARLLTSTLNFPDPGPLEGVRGRNKVGLTVFVQLGTGGGGGGGGKDDEPTLV